MKSKVGLVTAVVFCFSIFLATPVQAVPGQWSSSGSHIYYTDGNVGLGVSSPMTRLDVSGNLQIKQSGNGFASQVFVQDNGLGQKYGLTIFNGNGLFFGRTNGLGSGVASDIHIGNSGGIESQVPSNGAATYVVTPNLTTNNPNLQRYGVTALDAGGMLLGRTANLAAGVWEDIFISKTGNVGMGTFTTPYKLNVNGTIRAKEIIVNNGWADYVFEDDYKLPTIAEVSQFIQENNQLPGLPSADEIQSNGLTVGEVMSKQQEKIEELMLYVIQLENRIKSLEVNTNNL